MGYIVTWVQVDGVQGYDEDQITLMILDLSNFAAWVPVILGTPHNKPHCEHDQEEGDRCPGNALGKFLSGSSFGSSLSYSHSGNDKVAAGESDPSEYDKVVTTKDTETIDAFSFHVICARMGTAYTGEGINVMTQALCAEDGSLPQVLTVQNTYTGLDSGSTNVAVVVRNSMAYPQSLRKKTPVVRAVVATWVPEPPMWTGMMEALDKAQGLQTPKLTMKQRQEKLFEELDLSGLESWPPELVDSAWSLLDEYHDILSLEPSELGCMHSTKHVIKVTDNMPCKEQFRQLPLSMVEEVHTHL